MDDSEASQPPKKRSYKGKGKAKSPSPKSSTKSAAATPYEFPEDALEGSAKLSIHTTYSRYMEQHLVDIETNVETARSAWERSVERLQQNVDPVTAAQMQEAFEATGRLMHTIHATRNTVRTWKATWEQGK